MAHFDAIDGTDNPGFFTDLVQKGKDILFVLSLIQEFPDVTVQRIE